MEGGGGVEGEGVRGGGCKGGGGDEGGGDPSVLPDGEGGLYPTPRGAERGSRLQY